MTSLRQWERNRRETWNSFPFSIPTHDNNMSERKNEHIICKYDGKISKIQFRSPTFDEMTTFDLDYHNDEKYLFMS